MKATRKDAVAWMATQETGYARTDWEKAKFLAGKLLPSELPHPALWWEVLKISRGLQ